MTLHRLKLAAAISLGAVIYMACDQGGKSSPSPTNGPGSTSSAASSTPSSGSGSTTSAAASATSGADAASGDAASLGTDAQAADGSLPADSGILDSSSGDADSSSGDGAIGAPTGDVLQHHTNPSRDGVTVDTSMTKALAGTLKVDSNYSPTITGNVYAQPLYVSSGAGGNPTLIVATESNHVIALDPQSPGTAYWDNTYGAPVTNVGAALGCGNIDPLGITGTPIVDPTSHTIYFDAMTLVSGTPEHMIHAVSIDTGMDLPGWPVGADDVPGFTSKIQNQRGALQLLNGVLYVPYGGHDGDCNAYFGWVLSVPVAAPNQISGWSIGMLASLNAASPEPLLHGGIWSVGGIATDGTSLFVSTGNTLNAVAWSGGEAVLRLTPPTPTFVVQSANAFYPTAWLNYDLNDVDLGGSNPILFDMPAAPIPHLVVALGKDGILYLLNRDNLGGEGNALWQATVATETGIGQGALNGAGAVYTTALGTYVAFHGNANTPGFSILGCAGGNLGVVRINPTNPPTGTMVWCSPQTALGSPMVTTTGTGETIVWDANTSLYGYDGDTGAIVFDGSSDPLPSVMQYFNTPIDAAGNIVVATTNPGNVAIFRP